MCSIMYEEPPYSLSIILEKSSPILAYHGTFIGHYSVLQYCISIVT